MGRGASSVLAARLLNVRLLIASAVLVLTACASGAGTDGSAEQPNLRDDEPVLPEPVPAEPDEQAAPDDAPDEAPDEDSAPSPQHGFGNPLRIGSFDASIVPGASGLAASRRFPGLLYLLDDREGTGVVHVLAADGTILGALAVDGLDARDTEALALGSCPDDDRSCLYVGDIGDNLRGRADVRVHRLPEPDLGPLLDGDPDPTRRIEVVADTAVLRYPDGPVDAEALLVDEDGSLYVVTKTEGVAEVYSSVFADGMWQPLGSLTLPPPRRPLLAGIVGNVVTDASVDGEGRVLLRTYDAVLLATPTTVGATRTDLTDLPDRTLTEVASPLLPQPEAVAWTTEDCGYVTVSERIGALWYVPCAPPATSVGADTEGR